MQIRVIGHCEGILPEVSHGAMATQSPVLGNYAKQEEITTPPDEHWRLAMTKSS